MSDLSRVQSCAEAMISQHGFLGVPVETFAQAGHNQLVALLNEGLNSESKVLDIGCGCLRAGYWLIRFLEPARYHGIEPARHRVEYGVRYLFTPDELTLKQPRFDFNSHFDSAIFGTAFDFFLAGSIWTHAGKREIEVTLDAFIRDSTPTGTFLTSYLPAESPTDDYLGDAWVGTSHKSNIPGVIRHSIKWIEENCERRGLVVRELPGEAFDGQVWLRIRRK